MQELEDLLAELQRDEVDVTRLYHADILVYQYSTVLTKIAHERERHDTAINKKILSFADAVKLGWRARNTHADTHIYHGCKLPIIYTASDLDGLQVGAICLDKRTPVVKYTFKAGQNYHISIPINSRVYKPNSMWCKKFSTYNPLIPRVKRGEHSQYYINSSMANILGIREDSFRSFRHPDSRFSYAVHGCPDYGDPHVDYSSVSLQDASDLHSYCFWILMAAIRHCAI